MDVYFNICYLFATVVCKSQRLVFYVTVIVLSLVLFQHSEFKKPSPSLLVEAADCAASTPTTMPNYIVSDASINQIVFAYLRDMGYSEALTALQLETGCAEGSLGSDLLYLNRLTLEGRWEDVLTYLRPMQRVLLGEYNR